MFSLYCENQRKSENLPDLGRHQRRLDLFGRAPFTRMSVGGGMIDAWSTSS